MTRLRSLTARTPVLAVIGLALGLSTASCDRTVDLDLEGPTVRDTATSSATATESASDTESVPTTATSTSTDTDSGGSAH